MAYGKTVLNVACFYNIAAETHHLPQVAVKAHSTILSTTSRTTLTQTFSNANDYTIEEATYVFPLYEGVSVVRFKATVGDRIIEGVVKEREEAKQEYEAAKDAGFTAALMEQTLEAADVFTTKIGNIPPKSTFQVDIEFIGELKQDLQTEGIRFTLPAELYPRYGNAQVEESDFDQNKSGLEATVDIQLPEGITIKTVQSPSHPIDVSIGNLSTDQDAAPSFSRASATLSKKETNLDTDLVIVITPSKTGEPTALLETHATLPNQRALMASLVPKFALPAETPEIIFVCDRSGSMQSNIPDLKRALNIFLKSLPQGVAFNICSFGSRFSFLWPKSRLYDQKSVDEATRHVATFDANYGGTEMYRPLEATFKQRLHHGYNLEVFLLTDGEIWDEENVFRLINEASEKGNGDLRVFSLGIGSGASTSLVEGVARAGNGFAQFVADGENMDKKVVRMLKASLFPHINNFKLEIDYEGAGGESDDFELIDAASTVVDFESEKSEKPKKATISLFDTSAKIDDAPPPEVKPLPTFAEQPYLQTPSSIPPLFPGSRSTVYVLLNEGAPHKNIKSVALTAPSKYGELRLEIPVTDVGRGTTLHQLAARKECRELEEGRGFISRAPDADGKTGAARFGPVWDKIIQREAVHLGLRYQVANKWCSFVAIEKMPDGTEFKAGSTHEKAEGSLYSDGYPLGSARGGAAGGGIRKAKAAKGFGFGGLSFRSKSLVVGSAPPPPPAPAPAARFTPSAVDAICTRGYEMPSQSQPVLFGAAAAPPAPKPSLFGGGGGLFGQRSGGGLFGGFGSKGSSNKGSAFESSASMPASDALFGAAPSPALAPQPTGASPALFGRSASPPGSTKRVGIQSSSPPVAAAPPAANAFSFGSFAPQAEAAEVSAPSSSPLETLTALQRFDGSWGWTANLERITGVTFEDAKSAAPSIADDALPTALAIAYFRTKLADDADVWELMVGKAEAWLASKGINAEVAVEAVAKLIK
ncbi:hypothetical protein A1Q1_05367 [Trichosporon asahii var. asahii CBS 2479]|uniref:von Willebrand domain-containing protein n=1 Tax=Trichosporon asahii var. asahii (strain ATCC 90039 / CBS 2479 / JCM 2466 / KCTC 7840 / NBRC 103889/ NCYC 2677 / UAMH 7654) TaxID=1186058 RepID=J5SKR7_TRIAS|nr:hypothetical protein A1Q1_05367 [Trichosporon asahii var. asahii CBS 2479]EJT46156.1 hypothetical protein A1Q1_05367 [Trichosporon asahii var. asahii CBS 2479]